MKFTISKLELEGAVVIIQKVIDNRNAMPILADILCDVKDNELTMTAGNGEYSIMLQRDIEDCDSAGKFCVNAAKLRTALSSLSDEPIVIEYAEDVTVTLTHSTGSVHFAGDCADEYPVYQMPGMWTGNSELLEAGRLGDAINRCLWAADTNTLRPVMCGVHLCSVAKYNALDVVASDGKALVRTRLTGEGYDLDDKISVIIPTKIAKMLADTLNDDNPVIMRTSEGKMQIETDAYVLTFSLIDGNYPKYNSIIPSDNHIEALLDKSALATSIKRTLPFSPDATKMLTLHFEDSQLEIASSEPTFNEGATDIVACEYNCTDPFTIGMKGSTIAKALGYIDCHSVRLKMKHPTTAFLLEPENQYKDTEITILAMPMLIND